MLKDLRERIGYLSKNLNQRVSIKKDVEVVNKQQLEMKITISGMKNSLEGINSRMDEAEDWMSELEDKMTVSTQGEKEKEKRQEKWGKSKEHLG